MARSHLEPNVMTFCHVITESRLYYNSIFRKCKMRMKIITLIVTSGFFKICFNWRLITLQYCSGFCHTFTWISLGCSCVPHPEPASQLPLHPIPQGCPSEPAWSVLFYALNLDWWSISHMVIHMFQSYSFKSSHSRLLPESKRVFFTSVSLLLSHM